MENRVLFDQLGDRLQSLSTAVAQIAIADQGSQNQTHAKLTRIANNGQTVDKIPMLLPLLLWIPLRLG
jgi:hypothetical protein